MIQKRIFQWFFALALPLSVCLHAAEETPRKALTQAIEKGDLAKVQSLIDTSMVGIDELSADYDPKSPLLEAAIHAKVPIIYQLVERGACVEGASEKGYTPLVKFIEAGRKVSFQQLVETVRFLIERGADPNGAGKDGYTPLMAACQHSRCIELIELLLDSGAFIDAQDKEGQTAFLVALRNNNVKAYRFLLSCGANTNAVYKQLNPLSVLAWEGNTFMLKIFLEEVGGNVNAYNPSGITPLMAAVIGDQAVMIQFLVERGANLNAKTLNAIDLEITKPPSRILTLGTTYVKFPKGSTALNFAKTLGNAPLEHLIVELGGVVYQEVEYKEYNSWYDRYRY